MESVYSSVSSEGETGESSRLKFSVIMPCYNSESYVCNAVESIVNQTYPNWELIAVNDGSADGTERLLKEYSKKDGRIQVYSKENGGYISAVNFGLEKLGGDYFLLLGSDDRLAENLFYELNKSAVNGLPDCIAFRTVTVQDGVVRGLDTETDFTGEASMFRTTFAAYASAYPSHAAILSSRDTSKCYKRAILGGLRYFGKYGYDADGIFSMLLCHNASSFSAIPVDGYFWTLRGDSLSGRKSFFAQDCDRIENWTTFYRQLLKHDTAEITITEKEYLYYFLDIIGSAWRVSKPFLSQYGLVRDGLDAIRKMLQKTNGRLSLSFEAKLLLYAPVSWKLYTTSSCSPRTFIRKVRTLCKP